MDDLKNIRNTQPSPSTCPICKGTINGVWGLGDPKPGDVIICAKCHGLSILDEDLQLRLPTPEELTEMEGDLRLGEVIKFVENMTSLSRTTHREN